MAQYVTKDDGIRDFLAHDNAGFFKYIDSMIINSDFSLKRIPKDPKNPGPLELNSAWKMVPAYVNGYVDAFNAKYNKITSTSTYAIDDAAKRNVSVGISESKPPAIELGKPTVAVADATKVQKPVFVENPITKQVQEVAQAAKSVNELSAEVIDQKKNSWVTWVIAGVGLFVVIWFFIKRRKGGRK